MRVATSELLSDVSPIFKNAHVGTFVASLLGIVLVFTGWWQYLWVLFGGANQLMASLALMLVTAWLMSEGKSAAWTFYPMIFMFITTVAALIFTSYNLLNKVLSGAVKGEAYWEHPDGFGWRFPGHCGPHSWRMKGSRPLSAIKSHERRRLQRRNGAERRE